MARVTPAEMAEKWARKAKQAGPDYQRGVERVSEAPGMKAAARADAYRSGVERAVADGKFQRRSEAVSLEEWKRQTVTKGVPRMAAGIDGATPKMQRFASEFLPFQDAGVQQLPARGDIEQNIARSAEMQRYNARFRYGGGSGA